MRADRRGIEAAKRILVLMRVFSAEKPRLETFFVT